MHSQFTDDTVKRFWALVEKTPQCWFFTGTPSQQYGQLGARGQVWLAHRFAYTLLVGTIPDGLFVCHRCNIKRCVNPSHLYLGTARQNARDAVADGLWATGDRHWSRSHPEKVQRGDGHWSRKRPDLVLRGDRSGTRIHPESVKRGADNGNAALTDEQVTAIRRRYSEGGVSQHKLASEYRVHQATISRVLLQKTWRHLLTK